MRLVASLLSVLLSVGLGLSIGVLNANDFTDGTTYRVCSDHCTFKSIQAAINASSDGDVIIIRAGTYQETLSIDKSLQVKAAAEQEVIVRPTSPQDKEVIRIEGARQVSVSGLTIRGFDNQVGISLEAVGEASVMSNSISDVGVGIGAAIFDGSTLIIKANRISGRQDGIGIQVLGEYDATLLANVILDKAVGALIAGIGDSDVEDNIFVSDGTGLVIGSQAQANLQANNIRESRYAGVQIGDQAEVALVGNDVRGNGWGVALRQQPCFETGKEFNGRISGTNNVIVNSIRADLCPSDFPWPKGFKEAPDQ